MILINTHHSTACIHVLCATEVAEEVFNRCTFTNATKDGQIRPDSKDYRVIFNYEFLEDFQDPKSKFARAFTRRYVHGRGWLHNHCFGHQRAACPCSISVNECFVCLFVCSLTGTR